MSKTGNGLTYISPKRSILGINLEQEEEVQRQNAALYEAVAALFEEVTILQEEIKAVKGGEK